MDGEEILNKEKFILEYKHFRRIPLPNGKYKVSYEDVSENYVSWKEARIRVQTLEAKNDFYDEYYAFYINGKKFYGVFNYI